MILNIDELTNIHIAMHSLEKLKNPEVDAIVNDIRGALQSARDREVEEFEQLHNMYRRVAEENNFKSKWSACEVTDFNAPHPFKGAAMLIYKEHWGKVKRIGRSIDGDTWLDLYRAADLAIADSGDDHHIFIESFKRVDSYERDNAFLELFTGS